jgi:hypothetical protein
MSLKIIGAGFGRTGTLSLKLALEQLGLGPCYHMLEVQQTPARAGVWIDAANREPVDWDAAFEGFSATVDWPACRFWRELADHYPDAKVLLSLREANGWYKSISNTIFKIMSTAPTQGGPEFARSPIAMARRIVVDDTFDGRIDAPEHVIEVFNRHNQAVRDAIDPSRLLVYQPGDGWEPLCKFFDVPVPSTDYPHANSTDDFAKMFGNISEKSLD